MDDTRYAFIVEWYEEMAARTRKFQFFYFPRSKCIEMFDMKTNKLFLKTNIGSCPIAAHELYIGASINVLNRQLNFVDYGDDYTRRTLGKQAERTVGLIKPDMIEKMGEVIEAIVQSGLNITQMRLCSLGENESYELYAEHRGKGFMKDILHYITSGPVLAFELVGENAVKRWRELIGPYDPSRARAEASTSLRARFGKDPIHNGFFGSDSPEAVVKELEIFFPSNKNKRLPNCSRGTGCTCCVIKPHAVKEGLTGKIINEILGSGFFINTIEMFYLEKANVEEFLEVYKGVVHEYPGMVAELASGPCIAMEIVRKDPENIALAFRETTGPIDPEIARHLRPRSLRALFGINKVQNAIHCTDLPEDGELEVEYFFKILSN